MADVQITSVPPAGITVDSVVDVAKAKTDTREADAVCQSSDAMIGTSGSYLVDQLSPENQRTNQTRNPENPLSSTCVAIT